MAPDHRASIVLRTELGSGDPLTKIADQLALASSAPPDERASRFAAIGDRYSELGDRGAAREMYREALAHKPGDHLLLTKFLEVVTEDGDWSYSLDVIQKLIDTENDGVVRARYRHLAAMIARDELDDHERAVSLLDQAIEDHPHSFQAADDLEALHGGGSDRDALVRFFYRRLEQVRAEEGRAGERLRLWDRLGELSLDLERHEDALVAFEVAISLAPDDHVRRIRLTELYAHGDTKHDLVAIGHHQALLAHEHDRIESYKALRTLYMRTGQPEKARACDDALDALGIQPIGGKTDGGISALFEPSAVIEIQPPPREPPSKTFTPDDWLAIARVDVDLQLSVLFAVCAPPFAVERARMRPPITVPPKEHEYAPAVSRLLDKVVKLLGTPRPPVYVDREQATACKMAMRTRSGVLVPALVLGRPVLDKAIDDFELTFRLARQLADLRADRIARLLCPRAGEFAQIIELAVATPDAGDSQHGSRWLQTSLHPVELEQAKSIGNLLRERKVHPMGAALAWLAATERGADRVGFVITGDLKACVKILEREAQDAARISDLVWSSVTEEVLGVRARVEAWTTPTPAPLQSQSVSR